MTIKGIDVSKHQKAGKVSFEELKKLGYDFVIVRAGYGKVLAQKDTAFESHYKAAKGAGLHVGAYHYSYAVNVAEAEQEADCFLKWIEDKELDYPVAFDIEDATQKVLTNKQRTDIALAFMEKVKAAGYYVMIYSSASWLGSKLDMDRLKDYDVWCAAYVGSEANIKKYYDGEYGIWQYSSSIVLPTVYTSRLDHNYAYKDYAKIIRDGGYNNLKKVSAPATPDIETPTSDNSDVIDLGDIENWVPEVGGGVEIKNANMYVHAQLPAIRYKEVTGVGIVNNYRKGTPHPYQVSIYLPSGSVRKGWVNEDDCRKPKSDVFTKI